MNTRLLVGALADGLRGRGCAANAAPASPSATPASSNTRAAPTRAVRQLRDDLSRVFGAKVMERGVWGVEVRSLASGESLFELNAGKLMMPASNMKIVTLAATAGSARLGLPLQDDPRDDRGRSSTGPWAAT